MIRFTSHANLEASVNARTQKLTAAQIITERALFASVYTLLDNLWPKCRNFRLPHFDGSIIKVTQEGQAWVVSLSHNTPELMVREGSISYGDLNAEGLHVECTIIRAHCELYTKQHD